MAIAFLTTLAVQVGSAYFNSRKSTVHNAEMAKKQQSYEEKVALEGIENARAEFAELCALQREIESSMQRDRLDLIRANHQKSLMLEAYTDSLSNWPLLVPPYVIKNDSIFSFGVNENQSIPLNCILTPSADWNFNNTIYYKLEENLAIFCSKYWNVATNKSIRFLQETWRDNFKDIGSKHKDLYAHLEDIPTLVISPIIRNDKLIFRFYWWGLSLDPSDAHVDEINELDPEIGVSVLQSMKYSEEVAETIISECTPKLEAFISFFADLYYWNFYRIGPSLPSLINKGSIELSLEEGKGYLSQYNKQFSLFIEKRPLVNNLGEIWSSFRPALNDIQKSIVNLTSYVETIPDAIQIIQIPFLEEIKQDIGTNFDQRKRIDNLIDNIRSKESTQKEQGIKWTMIESRQIDMAFILSTCLEAVPFLPPHDMFNVYKNDSKLGIVAFFSKNGQVVSWDKYGIWAFFASSFKCPANLFHGDRFSCSSESLKVITEIINKNMNNEDVFAIIDGQYETLKKELLPAASKISDLFEEYINKVKASILAECQAKEVETLNRKELKYEDIITWLRKGKTAIGSQRFNGAFLTKECGGFFDKYHNKLYVCLTLDKQPLIKDSHPKCIFIYEKSDDTLDDLFGDKQSVQLNFK